MTRPYREEYEDLLREDRLYEEYDEDDERDRDFDE